MTNTTGSPKHPKVSVLVPVYNGEKYLAECLDSILVQDFAEMEILIADDGSTDGSRELVEEYAARDGRIRWWRNPANLGLAGNFNHCLRAARGDYIKFVLQDDKLLSPLAIRRMVNALDANPAVTLVGSASYLIDCQSDQTELRNSFRKTGVMDGNAVIFHCIAQSRNDIGEPTVVMFRRERKGVDYDERYKQLVDLDLWCRLLEDGKFAYLDEPLCAFRLHPEQQTAVNRRTRIGEQEELILALYWLGRPSFRKFAGRRMLFEHILNLRKRHGPRAEPFMAEAIASLDMKWYAWYSFEARITKFFKKLNRSLEKRLATLNKLTKRLS